MSHKTEVHVKVDNEKALKEALEEMGYQVRTGRHTLSAFDWSMTCDLSLVKDGEQLNVGFLKQDDGYKVEADWWRTGVNSKEFSENLNVLHGKHKVKNWLKDNKYKVTYEEDEEGSLIVVGSRWKS